jgi:hypothetical protein
MSNDLDFLSQFPGGKLKIGSMVNIGEDVPYNNCVTAIISMVHIEGMLIESDSLQINAKNGIIHGWDDDYPKVHNLTDHAIIGFSAADIKTDKLEDYAESIREMIT